MVSVVKYGIAGSGREQHDAALAEIFQRALAVIGFAYRGIASAESVRASCPLRSIAASSTRQFITVASMPMVSPTGRGTPLADTSTPRKILPPPTTTPSSTPILRRRHEIGGERSTDRLIDAEFFRPGERFAGELDDHASVGRIVHARAPPRRSADRDQRCPAVGRDLGGEVGLLLLDALAERIAHETGDLDRRADLAFGLLERLGHALLPLSSKMNG